MIPRYMAGAIMVHDNKKKSLQALYLNISDEDLLATIDMMRFDTREANIRVNK